jgi:hypothetical protein
MDCYKKRSVSLISDGAKRLFSSKKIEPSIAGNAGFSLLNAYQGDSLQPPH